MNIKFKILLIVFIIILFNQRSLFSQNKIDSLITNLNFQKDDSSKINDLIYISDLYGENGNFDSAHLYIDKAIEIAKKIDDSNILVKVKGKKGRFFRKEGQLKESLKILHEAFNLAQKIDDKYNLIDIVNNIGITYRRLAEDDKALNYHLQAYTLAEELNDLRNLAVASNSIGIIYTWQKHYDKALPYFDKAIEIEKKTNNSTGIAINLNSIAWVYELKKEYHKAIEYYKQSLDVNIEANNKIGIAICYNDLGKVYRTLGEYEQSLDYYKKALEVNKNLGHKRYIATNYIYLGEVYKDIGNYERSLTNLATGLIYAQEIKDRRLLQLVWEQFSYTYEKLNKNIDALEAYKMSASYKDTIIDEEKAKQIIEMQTRYETDRKEQEIKVLNSEKAYKEIQLKKSRLGLFSVILISILLLILFVIQYRQYQNRKKLNAILNVKNKQLKQFVSAKDRFISIIAHDLKGPLSAFTGIVEILNDKIEEMKLEEAKELINILYGSSEKINEMLLGLLEWAQLQRDKKTLDVEQINLKDTIMQAIILSKDMAAAKEINIVNKLDEQIEVDASKNGILTISNNLISNAIKFSPEKSEIIIDAKVSEEKVEVSVKDQGIGIAEKDIKKLFKIEEDTREIGNSKQKGTGMGLIICRELIIKMNGEIRVESELSKGSSFIFSLPLSKV